MTDAPPPEPTILLIEDDAATSDFLRELLSMSGYTVVAAATGAAGLAHAGAAAMELVVLDRRLLDGDGLLVSRRMRDELGLTTPILLLTADHDPALGAAAQAAGVTDVLHKPFDPDVLLARVTALMRPIPLTTQVQTPGADAG